MNNPTNMQSKIPSKQTKLRNKSIRTTIDDFIDRCSCTKCRAQFKIKLLNRHIDLCDKRTHDQLTKAIRYNKVEFDAKTPKERYDWIDDVNNNNDNKEENKMITKSKGGNNFHKITTEESDLSKLGIQFTGDLANIWYFGYYQDWLMKDIPTEYFIQFIKECKGIYSLQAQRAYYELQRREKEGLL